MPDNEKSLCKVRIEFFCRKRGVLPANLRVRRFRFVQGKPAEWWIRVKNLGNEPTPPLELTNFNVSDRVRDISSGPEKTFLISQLNPNSSTELFLDSSTLKFKGSAWVSFTLTSKDENYEVQTFQFDPVAKEDDACTGKNIWGEIVYIEGELEMLQKRSNLLLVMLTSVIVVETAFGMTESLKFVIGLMYAPFKMFVEFIGTLLQ